MGISHRSVQWSLGMMLAIVLLAVVGLVLMAPDASACGWHGGYGNC